VLEAPAEVVAGAESSAGTAQHDDFDVLIPLGQATAPSISSGMAGRWC